MSATDGSLDGLYASALQDYLTHGQERFLEQAYEIGRRSVEEQRGILDLVVIHQKALQAISEQPSGSGGNDRVNAFDFLREALASFEMTQRGYAETMEKLRDLNESLEKQVDERTSALTIEVAERKRIEAELRQTLSKLQFSNAELQDFANVASHDLQEPLRKIQTFGDRLFAHLADSLSDQNRDFLKRMQGAAGRMQVLIDDLLSFSRVTTMTQPFVPVDLTALTKSVIGDLEIRIERDSGIVNTEPMPVIDCDPSQMRRLLQNLIANALKFHAPGKPPVVHVSCVEKEDSFDIEVADKGIGFDEKYLDRIFTPFQRLHGLGEYEGTGMGLAIVRKIAQRHGGSVSARGRPTLTEGSTFVVTLPKKR